MSDRIAEAAKKLAKKSGGRDPYKAADALGIHILNYDLGSLKGMYSVIKRSRFIIINASMPKSVRRIVCAHELGHDALHRDAAADAIITDKVLFGLTARREYEANIFAAHFLLDEDEVVEYIDEGMTADQIAAAMRTDVNLVSIIVEALSTAGRRYNYIDRKANFLK